jgi:hypothetical protein
VLPVPDFPVVSDSEARGSSVVLGREEEEDPRSLSVLPQAGHASDDATASWQDDRAVVGNQVHPPDQRGDDETSSATRSPERLGPVAPAPRVSGFVGADGLLVISRSHAATAPSTAAATGQGGGGGTAAAPEGGEAGSEARGRVGERT